MAVADRVGQRDHVGARRAPGRRRPAPRAASAPRRRSSSRTPCCTPPSTSSSAPFRPHPVDDPPAPRPPASAVVRLVLARLCPSLTLTGTLTRCAPAAAASCAPFRFGRQRHDQARAGRARPRDHLAGVGHRRDHLRRHEAADLDLRHPGRGDRPDPVDLDVRRHARLGHLQPVPRPHLANRHPLAHADPPDPARVEPLARNLQACAGARTGLTRLCWPPSAMMLVVSLHPPW